MATHTHSTFNDKHNKIYFTGREEDFMGFEEKFEARMYMQKLKRILDGKCTAKDLTGKADPTETELEVAEEKLAELKYEVWCELVNVIDNKSINYIRKHKGDGPEAWKLLRSRYKSIEKPRIHNLQQTLVNMKMKSDESVVDYICRAESLQTELEEVKENVTDSMFKSIVMGGLRQEFNQIVTLHNFAITEIPFETLKKKLVNFEQTNKTNKKDESAFTSKDKKCYNCGKTGHVKAECWTKPRQESKITCFNCGKEGHRQRECRAPRKDIKTDSYCTHCKKKGHNSNACRLKDYKGRTERTNYVEETTVDAFSFLSAGRNSQYEKDVLVDSGCTNYMIKDRDLFVDLDESRKGIVGSADSESTIEGRGNVKFKVQDARGDIKEIELKDALFVPSYSRNLVSVAKLKKSGVSVRFDDDDYLETRCGTKFPLIADEELFIWKLVDNDRNQREQIAMASSLKTWHERLGHNNIENLRQLPNLVFGMEISSSNFESCRECNLQKATRKPVSKDVGTRAETKLDIVHVDVLGPIETESRDGHKYAIGFVDSWSRYVTVYFMKTRDEVPDKIEKYFAEVGTPKTLVTDGAREFTSRYMEQMCRRRGVRQEISAPYTPEENGKIERIWGTVVGMSRCILATAGLGKEYWTYALNHAFYIKNRILHSGIGITPFELYNGKKPDLRDLKTFGCLCYVFIEKQFRKKFDARANEAIFLGYDGNSKTVIFGTLEENGELKIKKSRNVKFNETITYMKRHKSEDEGQISWTSFNAPTRRELERSEQDSINQQENIENNTNETDIDEPSLETQSETNVNNTEENTETSTNSINAQSETIDLGNNVMRNIPAQHNADIQQTIHNTTTTNTMEEENEETLSRNEVRVSSFGRTLKPNVRHRDYIPWDEIDDEEIGMNSEEIPRGAKTALKDDKWKKAMEDEYNSLIDNNVWHLVPKTKDTIPVTGKWCFTHKYGPDGQITRYKARYVARGFSQVQGRDYEETYSPTVRYTTIRTILALAAQRGMSLHQMDIKTAYLNAKVDEDIYLEQPVGFEQKGKNGEELVCKLDKSLYGLKQSGRNWHNELKSFLITRGFKQAEYDSCLFTKKNQNGKMDFILVWVDDLILCSDSETFAIEFKKAIETRYKISEFSELHWFLGMNIAVDRQKNEIRINQKKYINNILEKHGMEDCKPVSTPAIENTKLTKQDCPREGSVEQNEMRKMDYRGIVGSLNYLAQSTRPDIAFVAHRLSCFVNNPSKIHYVAAKRVLRYLKGTKDVELIYRKDTDGLKMSAVSDADWAGNTDNSRSTSGFGVKLNKRSATISWNSKLQNTIALSTAEAELAACKLAVQEIIYIKGLLEDVNITTTEPIEISTDNQAMIAMCNNASQFAKTKHVAISINFVKDNIAKKKVKLSYLPTDAMPADLLTKHLGRIKSLRFMTYFNGQ
jgi:hypothetical protein